VRVAHPFGTEGKKFRTIEEKNKEHRFKNIIFQTVFSESSEIMFAAA